MHNGLAVEWQWARPPAACFACAKQARGTYMMTDERALRRFNSTAVRSKFCKRKTCELLRGQAHSPAAVDTLFSPRFFLHDRDRRATNLLVSFVPAKLEAVGQATPSRRCSFSRPLRTEKWHLEDLTARPSAPSFANAKLASCYAAEPSLLASLPSDKT